MREDGILKITKENLLAKERMENLLFYKDNAGHYPQRVVNGNLHIVAIRIKPISNKSFSRENMLSQIGIGRQQNISQNFDNIYNWIIGFWDSLYHFSTVPQGQKLREDAYDYIVYKTLKIVSNYKNIVQFTITSARQKPNMKMSVKIDSIIRRFHACYEETSAYNHVFEEGHLFGF